MNVPSAQFLAETTCYRCFLLAPVCFLIFSGTNSHSHMKPSERHTECESYQGLCRDELLFTSAYINNKIINNESLKWLTIPNWYAINHFYGEITVICLHNIPALLQSTAIAW